MLFALLLLIEFQIYDKNSIRCVSHQTGINVMKPIVMMRRGKIEDLDRSFDLEFWQKQTFQSRFAAAREPIIHAWRVKGHDDVGQLRLQRSVETFQRQER
jgi:hypothetical protein